MLIKQLKNSFVIREKAEILWDELDLNYNRNDTEILETESKHQKLIQKLSDDEEVLKNIFSALKDDDINIQQEAFLVVMESQNENLIKKVIEWMAGDFTFVAMLYYLSDEALKIFFKELRKVWSKLKVIPYSKNIGAELVLVRKLDNYLSLYVDLDKFDKEAQEEILENLCVFPEFKEVFIKNYNHRQLKFSKGVFNDNNPENSAQLLLLAKEEEKALELLRKPSNIISEWTYDIYLNSYGNKSDCQLVLGELEKVDDKDAYRLSQYIQGLKEGGGNYIYVNFLLEKIKLGNPSLSIECCEHLSKYFLLDGSEDKDESEDEEKCYSIMGALSELECLDSISELEIEDQEKVNPDYIILFWREVFEKNKNLLNNNLRIDLYEGGLFSLDKILNYLLEHGSRRGSVPLSHLHDLIIYTGEYFPLNIGGYYTQAKKDISVWQNYLKNNKEKFKPGRWYRYGKYVE